MRRGLIALTVLVGVLALSGANADALGRGDRTLTGDVVPSGTVTIDIHVGKKHGYRFRTYKVRFDNLPMECDGGPSTFDFDGGGMSTRNDARGRDDFGLGVVARGRHGERTYSWEYSGKLTSRNRAEGVVRARGTRMPVDGGGHDSCDTGTLEWSASTATGR